MIYKEDIRAKLAAVAAGELPLWDFYDWLEIASLNMHRDSSAEAKELVGEIGLIFADYDVGIIGDKPLKDKLVSVLHPAVVYDYGRHFVKINASPVSWASGLSDQWSQTGQVPQPA